MYYLHEEKSPNCVGANISCKKFLLSFKFHFDLRERIYQLPNINLFYFHDLNFQTSKMADQNLEHFPLKPHLVNCRRHSIILSVWFDIFGRIL